MNESSELESKLAELGWALTHVGTPGLGALFTAERIFPGNAKPVRQSAATERGLLQAVESYERHKSGDSTKGTVTVSPDMARRLAASNVATGLVSTETYRTNR